ncbi:hypothetical protein GCM10023321_58740 [Pseudonocardia eucalypti]|uniref:Anti-sigma K factor RskA C-terminal domain-containing protein n=1 Tax=Pseudonocardia eucalypti TaxID=648755 RepID=A0ABP9QT52_9PSEU|nr:hypothetical protein [Pseudonocardia eucalypti]
MTAGTSCPMVGQAVGWVMHALEPVDEEAFVEHLPHCHVCRAAVRQTEDLMRLVAAADEQLDPGPELRERVLAEVAATPQTPRDQRATPWPKVAWGSGEPSQQAGIGLYAWEPPRPPAVPGEFSQRQAAQQRRQEASRRKGLVVLLAAAAFVVIGLGGIAARSLDGGGQQQQVQAQAEAMQQTLAQVKTPGSRYAVLNARNGAPVAAVLLDGGERRLVQVGLPMNGPEESYVLWGTGAGKPVALATFNITMPANNIPLSLGSAGAPGTPEGLDAFPSYAITVEVGKKAPEGPSPAWIASGQVTS